MMSYDYPHPVSRTYQYKKITKPLLERKRRARINRCLDELKDLMVDALETEGENISKLEKADILELTVRHLQRLQASRPSGLSTVATPGEDSSESRWRSGFGHCAAEACRFLTALPGEAADRLARHLATGLQSPRQLEVQVTTQKVSNSPALSPTIQRPVDLVSPSLASLEKTANLLAPSLVSPSLSSGAGSLSPRHNLSPRETSHPYSAGKMNIVDRPPTAGCVSIVIKEANIRPASRSVGKETNAEENGRRTVGAQATPLIICSAQSIVPTSTDQRIHDATKPHQLILPDDDEEIDVENIDEGDPMWRPW